MAGEPSDGQLVSEALLDRIIEAAGGIREETLTRDETLEARRDSLREDIEYAAQICLTALVREYRLKTEDLPRDLKQGRPPKTWQSELMDRLLGVWLGGFVRPFRRSEIQILEPGPDTPRDKAGQPRNQYPTGPLVRFLRVCTDTLQESFSTAPGSYFESVAPERETEARSFVQAALGLVSDDILSNQVRASAMWKQVRDFVAPD